MDEQMLRITLPTGMLREVDRHLELEGASRTRADFVRESVEQRLLELRYGEATAIDPGSPLDGFAARRLMMRPPLADEADDVSDDPMLEPRRIADTALAVAG